MTGAESTTTRSGGNAWLAYAFPVGLSAFLLFTAELLVGRQLLPLFGGGPMVWTAVLAFFQIVLVAGYAYGHLSVAYLERWGPPVHLVLIGLAFLGLLQGSAVAVPAGGSASGALDAFGPMLGAIGLPAFVVAASTPLLSAWMTAGRGSRTGGGPSWLYAVANAGSLIALVAYPLLVEPRLGLAAQRFLWTVVFGAYAILVARVALRLMVGAPPPEHVEWVGLVEAAPDEAETGVDWPRRARWLVLAAVPTGLLSAVTTFITTDLSSGPLLWVLPLLAYLASLIVAFGGARRVVRWAWTGTPAAAVLLWMPYSSAGAWPIVLVLVLVLLGFLVVATGIHGRLAQDRPSTRNLTDFYLTTVTGSAIGGLAVAVLAPVLFPDLWEYPLLLVAALAGLALVAPVTASAASAGLTFGPFLAGAPGRLAPYLVAAIIIGGSLYLAGSPALVMIGAWLAIGGLILLLGGRPWALAASMAVFVVLGAFVLQGTEARGRSFFGVSRVLRSNDTGLTTLVSGTTVHGAQWTDPARHDVPTGYYGPGSPAAELFEVGAPPRATGATNVGVVGLGAGELSAQADAFTVMTYFEIDPVVARLAQDPKLFTYLTDHGGSTVVLGDGRRSLGAQPDGRFDLLIVDAFTSDAVPTHLITLEAITDQLRTLAPDGVLAFNVSNRTYDLAPPIAAALGQLGLVPIERSGAGSAPGELPSRWLATSRDGERVSDLRALGWQTVVPADHPFTDDYADLLSYLQLAP